MRIFKFKNVIFLLALFVLVFTNCTRAQCVSGDCQNGFGGIIYPNGDKYIGEFRSGLRDGFGKYYAYLNDGTPFRHDGFFKKNVEEIYAYDVDLKSRNSVSGLMSNGRFFGYYQTYIHRGSKIIEQFYNSNGLLVDFVETNPEHAISREQYSEMMHLYEEMEEKFSVETDRILLKMK